MATLKELVSRFKNVKDDEDSENLDDSTTFHLAKVLTKEELEDPRTYQLAVLARQQAKADSHDIDKYNQKQEKRYQEGAARQKDKMATAFGLNPEERKKFGAPPASVPTLGLKPSLKEAVKSPAPPPAGPPAAPLPKEQIPMSADMPTGTPDTNSFLKGIAGVETGGTKNEYSAENPNSSAVGKYQFLWNTWGKQIQQFSGNPNLTKEDFKKDPKLQEKWMQHYSDNILSKQADDIEKQAKHMSVVYGPDLLKERGINDKHDLMALIHFQGPKGALRYLQKGEPGNKVVPNAAVPDYLQKFRNSKAAASAPVLGTPSAAPKQEKPAVQEAAPAVAAAPEKAETPPAPPTGLQKILGDFQTKIDTLGKEASGKMQTELSNLNNLEATYRKEAQEAKSDIERRELAEMMGHALAQFGAGLYGMKNGVDMSSGLKFNKTDWNKRYESALDELKTNLADLREKRQEARLRGTEETREGIQQAQFTTGIEAQEQMQKERETAAESRAGASAEERRKDRESRENIEMLKQGTKEALAQQKILKEEQKGVQEALNNYVNVYTKHSGASDKATKRNLANTLSNYEATLSKQYGPDLVNKLKKTLEGEPFYKGDFSSLEDRAPKAQKLLQSLQQQAQPGGAPAGQAATSSAIPKVGTVKQGYRFKGGDPKNQKNWEKI